MRKSLLIVTLLGTYTFAQDATPKEPESNHNLMYSLDLGYRLDGAQYEGVHLVEYTYKFANGYNLQGAFFAHTYYTKNESGSWHDTWQHDYLQLRWSTPKLWNILGFDTNVQVRYALPTANDDQLSGSYGNVIPRLVMEREFNSHFNLTMLPKIGVYFQRNGYPVRDGAKSDRNNLAIVDFEILPQWKILENLTLTYDAEISGLYKGNGAQGEHSFVMEGDFTEELELMYTLHQAGDLGVGWFINDGNDGHLFGNYQSDMGQIAKGKYLFTGLRLIKAIDL